MNLYVDGKVKQRCIPYQYDLTCIAATRNLFHKISGPGSDVIVYSADIFAEQSHGNKLSPHEYK